MSPRELLRRFPNASRATLQANGCNVDPETVRPGKNADPQPVLRDNPLGTTQDQEANPKRFLVCILSVRKRLSDAESLVPKWHVDCLRYAGVIEDDTAELLECRTTQRKCAKGEEEHTEIEVYRL